MPSRPSRVSRAFAMAGALAALLALAACSSPLDKPPVEQRFYTLDVTRPEATEAAPDAPVLAVRRFRASPGYEGRELVFATDGGAFRTDFYNLFFAPPAAMVGDEAREWLERSGLFRAAVASTSQADPHYALEGSLTAVHGARTDGANRAVLEVQFLLIDTRAANTPIVFQRRYRRETPVADGGAAALAAGLDRALAGILTELETDLAPVVRRPAAAAPEPAPVRSSRARSGRR